jgi:tetratricopeptide (TPR) repeat protein
MVTTRHMHLHLELVKWLAVLALAAALAIAAATRMAGAQQPPAEPLKPGLLPATIESWAQPMGDVWQILEQHRAGDFGRAIHGWQTTPLPYETEVWRYVALAQAFVATADVDAAAEALEQALCLEPDNAVAHYYLGLLRLEQAELASEWHDAIRPLHTRLVARVPLQVSPNSKSMYKLAAMMELERAIELAPLVNDCQPLLPVGWTAQPASAATVGDLLVALSADRFEAKAHNVLSYLHLERGSAEAAEQHMDQAAALGLHIVYGYGDVGELYEQQHRYEDAARVYLKSMEHSRGIVLPATKTIENLRKAILELW